MPQTFAPSSWSRELGARAQRRVAHVEDQSLSVSTRISGYVFLKRVPPLPCPGLEAPVASVLRSVPEHKRFRREHGSARARYGALRNPCSRWWLQSLGFPWKSSTFHYPAPQGCGRPCGRFCRGFLLRWILKCPPRLAASAPASIRVSGGERGLFSLRRVAPWMSMRLHACGRTSSGPVAW